MKPIEIKITAHSPRSPQELFDDFLDVSRWSEFKGYFILPGIEKAEFEFKTPDLIGSRVRVHNTDGSTHVEEIIEWDAQNRIAVKFQAFEPPVKHLATHFIETWEFRCSADGTQVTRSMRMYPKGWAGWFMLVPISRLMKKAFEKQLSQSQK